MDVKDLDFIELLQKPLEEPVFAPHIEEQLSKQELETVVGGSEPVKTVVEGLKPAPLPKIADRFVVEKEAVSFLVKDKGETMEHPGEWVCFPYDLPPYHICLQQSSASF